MPGWLKNVSCAAILFTVIVYVMYLILIAAASTPPIY